ncbi:hypothetical protein BGZ65_001447 [Modicella reniformis]|uniref:Ras-GEF domain-containing protein n=1 Tax=Modicella reniformis TaxID=1440133 RepID=A0A9P6MIU4_9FUNG|nr:hypothetical protein BGZ65_001447 [Modicella reniformis]
MVFWDRHVEHVSIPTCTRATIARPGRLQHSSLFASCRIDLAIPHPTISPPVDMDLDVATYTSLLHAAKAEHNLGDLQSAFATYLKAHTIIMRILGEQIVFKNQDSIESAPDNYTQLIVHAQEILRRIKDIIAQSKALAPKNADPAKSPSSVSFSVTSRLPKTTPSLSLSPAGRPGLASSQPSQRSIGTTSRINKRTKKNVPMIPISPLTKQALLHSHALAQVTQKFEQAKQGSVPQESSSQSSTRDLARLRKLIEDVHIQRAKVDAVNAQILSVTSSTLISWDPDLIARQLTIMDLQLFKEVAIPKDLVCADRRITPVQNCIDFEIYVAHSVAHLLLVDWNASRQSALANGSANSKGHAQAPVNAVAHMIRVAYILLNVYRNFNSFMAIMRALTSPEITRMHRSWSGISSKTKELFRRMVPIYRVQDNNRNYKEALIQKLDAFQDVGKDAVVAIPWMRSHLVEVRSIVNSYLTGQNSADGSGDVILSAPGARKLSAVSSLLTQCRKNETSGFDMDNNPMPSKTHIKHREPILVDGLKPPLVPILDLVSLSAGDLTLQHWLLSRPFLNKQQLINESLEIEPLFNGEELPCYEMPFDNSTCEDISSVAEDPTQDDSFEHVVAPEHDLELQAPRPSLARERVSESEVNSILSELLKDDASDNKGLFDDIDDAGLGENTNEPGSSRDVGRRKGASEHSRDVLQFQRMDSDEHSDSGDDGDQSGDLGHKLPTSDKGKGRALDADDSEEINDLLARVKGLVQDSTNHSTDIKSRELGLDEQEAADETMDKALNDSAGRTIEPFQQGSEEDQLGNGPNHQSSDLPSGTRTVSSVLSLEALRRQLQSLGHEANATDSLKASGESEPSKPAVAGLEEAEDKLTKPKGNTPVELRENIDKIETTQSSQTVYNISGSRKHDDPSDPRVSIPELDKEPLDSLQASSSKTSASISTTTTIHSRAEAHHSVDTLFQLETSALEKVAEPVNPRFKVEGSPQQHMSLSSESDPESSIKEDMSQKNELAGANRDESKDASAGEDSGGPGATLGVEAENSIGAGDKSPRANRQRRRIAGGVISMPTQSKTLLSRASTSSLSNAYGHDAGTQQKDHEGDEIAQGHEQAQDQTLLQPGLCSTIVEGSNVGGGSVTRKELKDDEDAVTSTILTDKGADAFAGDTKSLPSLSPTEGTILGTIRTVDEPTDQE